MKRKMAVLLILLATASTALAGCSGSKVDSTTEAVSVDGVSIPLGEVNFMLRYQQIQMQSMYGSWFGDDFLNQDLTGSGTIYGETVRDTVVETLEEYYLAEAHAEELGVSLSEEEKTAAADAAKAFLADNDKKTLNAMSADEATVTHVLELAAIQNKVYENRAATIDTEVSEEESAQKRIYYVFSSTAGTTDDDGNTVDLTEDELAEKKSELEAVMEEAKESGDLNAAAEAHDLTASSATYGKDDTSLDENVYAAAEELNAGDYSDIVETDNGYYIVYMDSLYDEDATQTKVESILEQREQEAYSEWLDSCKEDAEITVNSDAVGTLTFERTFDAKASEEEDAEE